MSTATSDSAPTQIPAASGGSGSAAGAVLVAVVGPPGSGKSTVVASLAAAAGLPVFRLREAVRVRPDVLTGLGPSRDPLGWVSLEAVRRLLHTTFVQDRFGSERSVVLLDNFPGTVQQLALLAETGAATGSAVALLELRADARTVTSRVMRRRVCLACGVDPHAPAVPARDDPQRCGSCRAVLSRRDTDLPGMHALRLARYYAHRRDIAGGAAARRIPHQVVNADAPDSQVCQAAHRAWSRLIGSLSLERSRP